MRMNERDWNVHSHVKCCSDSNSNCFSGYFQGNGNALVFFLMESSSLPSSMKMNCDRENVYFIPDLSLNM